MGDRMTWDEEIMVLFKDFCLPASKGKQIVREVKKIYKNEPDKVKYRRAWQKFYDVLMAS